MGKDSRYRIVVGVSLVIINGRVVVSWVVVVVVGLVVVVVVVVVVVSSCDSVSLKNSLLHFSSNKDDNIHK